MRLVDRVRNIVDHARLLRFHQYPFDNYVDNFINFMLRHLTETSGVTIASSSTWLAGSSVTRMTIPLVTLCCFRQRAKVQSFIQRFSINAVSLTLLAFLMSKTEHFSLSTWTIDLIAVFIVVVRRCLFTIPGGQAHLSGECVMNMQSVSQLCIAVATITACNK
mgnify:CR=1 FL=1